MKMSKAKTWAATIGSAATLLATLFADNTIDLPEWADPLVTAVGLVATIYAVYKTRNQPLPPTDAGPAPRI